MIEAAHADALRCQIAAAGADCQINEGPVFRGYVGPIQEDEEGQTRPFAAELEQVGNPPAYGDRVQTPQGEFSIETAEFNFGLVIATLT